MKSPILGILQSLEQDLFPFWQQNVKYLIYKSL